jgi:hypothetical protein
MFKRSLLSPHERFAIDLAVRHAERLTRLEFSVYVGTRAGETRATAQRLHALLNVPQRSILLLADPERRAVEVVSGAEARGVLSDQTAAEVLRRVAGVFELAGLAAGVVAGVRELSGACVQASESRAVASEPRAA